MNGENVVRLNRFLEIKHVNVKDIKPYPQNAKKHDERQIENVALSIQKYGWKQPLVIDKDGTVVIGHCRLLAAEKLGLEEVPVIVADDLTEEEIRQLRIVDNKSNESEWDYEMLQAEFEEVDLEGFDFDFPVFEYDNIGGVTEDEDFEPEPPEKPKAKPGTVYVLGEHRVMCGDSTKAEDFARLMDGDLADMVFTDPPYNVAIGDRNKVLNENAGGDRKAENIEGDAGMTDEEIGETLWKPAFKNLADNSKDSCAIYVTMPQGGTHMMMMMMMMARASWQVKHELIWIKNAPTFSMGRLDYDYQHEPIMYGWKKSHNFYGNGDQNRSIWHYDKPRKADLHPTMKPVPLIVNAIKNSSKPGDIIADAFGGSGSVLIACEETGRKCRMMECDPKYVDVIIKRWEDYTGRKAEEVNE